MAKTEPQQKANADRIVVDNSNLTELKATCDEAVERILSRRPEADASSSSSANASGFAPFEVSHFHTDLRLVLGFTASAIMIGTSIWAYFVEKEWKRNKQACAIAVVIYILLSGIQMADSYLQANNIFTGTRQKASDRVVTERLTIASAPLPKATKNQSKTIDGKPILTPPAYTLQIDYTSKSNKSQSLLAQRKTSLPLGHLGKSRMQSSLWYQPHTSD